MLRFNFLRWISFALFVVFSASMAQAHDPFQSWASARLRGDKLQLEVTLAIPAALGLLDPETEYPNINPEDFDTYQPLLVKHAPELYSITMAGGEPLVPESVTVDLTAEDDIQFLLIYPRPEGGEASFHALYLYEMESHVGTLFVEDEQGADLGWSELTVDYPVLKARLPGHVTLAEESASPPPPPPRPDMGERFRRFVKLGVEHILVGYDHLLFLGGLLVACRRFKTMIGIITFFTIAHSITLALAALDVVSIPPQIVEPLIAASIVYVGIENLIRKDEPSGRWILTFIFGLIHGFGFASVLKQTGLGSTPSGLILPLFSFNLGVELGQIAVAAVVLPILLQLRKRPAFDRHGPWILSVFVAVLGLYWLLERTVFA